MLPMTLIRFSSHVHKTPDALAIVSGGDELTYRQMDERSNQLAHHLVSLGVGLEGSRFLNGLG